MKIWKWRKEKTGSALLRSLIAGEGRAEGKPTLFGPLPHSTLAPTSVSLALARFPPKNRPLRLTADSPDPLAIIKQEGRV